VIPTEFVIEPCKATDFPAIKALIESGLTLRFESYDATLNPDVANLDLAYSPEDACVAKVGEIIVGCGFLIEESPMKGQIVRMSVASHLQRRGVGRAILEALIVKAKARGYREISKKDKDSAA
jgi:predicted N-acetyltransferase YhbS